MESLKPNFKAPPAGTLVSNPECSAQQARYLNEHSTCAMCESILIVTHEVTRVTLHVKEEAHCPSCGIRVRSKHHLMH